MNASCRYTLNHYFYSVYPDTWEDCEGEDFKLVLLDPDGSDTEEWERIESKFLQTMPNVSFLKIERVQNKPLWRKYQHCSHRMYQYDGVLNEKLLFHGSRRTNPKEIYKGDDGFDIRCSNSGMWGRGSYFAANASYSDGYAHVVKGFKKMLAAWVLTGHSMKSDPHSYHRPPQRHIPGSAIDRRYDSVNGLTGGSRVYITYDNEHAYPAYLITYKA